MKIQSAAIFAVACLALAGATAASAATLDRIKETGHIKLGYLPDARPFTFKSDAGAADGYGVGLCQEIVGRLKAQLGLSELTADWVPVTVENRLSEVQRGNVDLLCAPTIVTLTTRKAAAFSIPIFAGGNRAVVRKDAPVALRDALAEKPSDKPVWRGSPAAKLLETTTFAVVAGTTTATWLEGRRKFLQVDAKITPVPDYRAGLQLVRDRKADVFFGERSLVVGAADFDAREQLMIVDRLFTQEQAGLALARGDEDFRLAVDTALSQLYPSLDFADLYRKWFGSFDESARRFFLFSTLSE